MAYLMYHVIANIPQGSGEVSEVMDSGFTMKSSEAKKIQGNTVPVDKDTVPLP